MSTDRANDLRAFRDFADEQLAHSGSDLTLEEALARWEYENAWEAEREATIRAAWTTCTPGGRGPSRSRSGICAASTASPSPDDVPRPDH